jgi:N-acetylglucosamine-6-phosphate deacetylase
MPHAGLMDTDALGPESAALQRARLHIRGGKRRLRQGKISAGLLTLYDALNAAMEWYITSPDRKDLLSITEKDDL